MVEIQNPKTMKYKKEAVDYILITIVLFALLVFGFLFYYNQYIAPVKPENGKYIQDLLQQKAKLEAQIKDLEAKQP